MRTVRDIPYNSVIGDACPALEACRRIGVNAQTLGSATEWDLCDLWDLRISHISPMSPI